MAVSSRPANSIGDYLTDRGWISGVELHYARQSQRQLGGRLETCLLAQGALGETQLLEALSEFHGLPAADADDLRRVSDEGLRAIPPEVARRLRAVPFGVVGDELWVAVESAEDKSIRRELEAVAELPIRLHISSEPRIAEALEAFFAVQCSARIRQLLTRLDRKDQEPSGPSLVSSAGQRTPEPRPVEPKPKRPVAAGGGMSSIPAGVLSTFERRLTHTRNAQETLGTLIDYLAREFRKVAVFRVTSTGVQGWLGRGGAVAEERLRRVDLSFEQPSVFLSLLHGAPFHLGALPEMDAHRAMEEGIGGSLPEEVLLLPIRVGARLVAVVYCDRGSQGLAGVDLGELQRMVAAAAESLERHLHQRKLRKT